MTMKGQGCRCCRLWWAMLYAPRSSSAHTVGLVLISLLPALYGMGWIYLGGAAIGGIWFVERSLALVREPTRKMALSNFLASLGQLTILLVGALLDRWLLGGPA